MRCLKRVLVYSSADARVGIPDDGLLRAKEEPRGERYGPECLTAASHGGSEGDDRAERDVRRHAGWPGGPSCTDWSTRQRM